jgi:ergot alkaloid biosynthesis protein
VSVLVTGATGKVGRRLAERLRTAGAPHRLASRHPAGETGVMFDWWDPATWTAALSGASAAYLIAPRAGGDSGPVMIEFVQQAIAAGVRRFVVQSGSPIPAGAPGAGKVHAWLAENATEWAVLRPSWFMQNFTEALNGQTIRAENAFYTAAGDGRVAFIDTNDIAGAAFGALTAPEPLNADAILTGPRAITYDEAAAIIGAVLGRQIEHRRVTPAEVARRHIENGVPEMTSQMLGLMDVAIANGVEDRVTDGVERLSGAAPISFEAFAARDAAAWEPANA